MARAFIVAAAAALVAASAFAAPSADLITSLPGVEVEKLGFKMYSGFLTVDAASNRRLFYWYAEAKKNPESAPLVVWYQGGPGCSGLIGFLSENGPLVPQPDGSIAESPLSWNTISNTLYIESPAFVGFSSSGNSQDIHSNDTKTARDNYVALQAFYDKFPELASRDMYFTGESYAGNYVPQLSELVVTGPNATLRANFKGFMIGNPVFSCPQPFTSIASMFQGDIWYYHAMLPLDVYQRWKDAGCHSPAPQNASGCAAITAEMNQLVGKYDPDDIFVDPCTGNSSIGIPEEDRKTCRTFGQAMSAWLNRADVQAALHAIPSSSSPPVQWAACSNSLQYDLTWPSSIPVYKTIAAADPKPRILVYSGDVDVAVCPAPTAQYCLEEIGSPETKPWRQWTVNTYTAGYVREFEDYTYVTVKGAGHTAPTFQPWEMFNLFQRYLTDSAI